MQKLMALGCALCLVLSVVLGGFAPMGRVLLSWGFPSLAQSLFDDPDWRGVAAFRAGLGSDAVNSFKGPDTAFNRGNAHVLAGEYAAALEAFDIATLHDTQDHEAEANFDLVASFYAGTKLNADVPIKWSEDKQGDTVAADVGKGNARAAGSGDGVNNKGALVGLPEIESSGLRVVRKVFDDKYMVANTRWLATLEDVPGAFLNERIKHEHKRRVKAGEAQPSGDPQW